MVTIQKILNEHGLGTKFERWLALENRKLDESMELTPEQIRYVEKLNPCFKERHVESSRPGELLSQDTFYVGNLKEVGKAYLHAVVDNFGSFAFGFLPTSKQPEVAVGVLHNDVLPFYAEQGLPVQAVLTDNGREFYGTEAHPYELYLALIDLEHRRTKVRRKQTNGFVERFHLTIKEEFFGIKFREHLHESVEALQTDLDEWLRYYNYERPHLGYSNRGRRPFDTVQGFTSAQLIVTQLPVTADA